MAININYNGATIFKPGAYSKIEVNLSGGFPIAPTGIVAIIGEAEGGEPGAAAGVQTFTSEDIAALAAHYKSGPLVDAARLLIAPAKDGRIPNGASLIRVWKTNASLQAALAFENGAAVDLFTFTSRNFGEDENLVKVKIEAGINPNARIITISKQGNVESLSENLREEHLNIQYTGAEIAADITIQAGSLDIAAGPDSISIALAGKSIQDIVDLIDSNANYSAASTLKLAAAKSAADLDPISTATDVKASALSLYAQQKELMDIVNGESAIASVARIADVEGIIVAAQGFLVGGVLGASANADFQAGFDALLAERCNIIVPMISRDASDLASSGLTDPASAFTVDAVNLMALTHCITASNTKNRSERNCYVSVKRSFALSQDAAQDLGHERASMLFQDVEILGSDGNLKWEEPWAASCMVAGMQAGTDIGTPATFKVINANGIRHADYNEKTQVRIAIEKGLIPLESRDQGGFRVVVHNATYSADANFVYNRPHVLEAADHVAYNLREQLEDLFVGEKARTGAADAIFNAVVSIMTQFKDAEIIVGDDTNSGLGWKDLTVTITGNVAQIQITITPVQGIDFILANITLDNIRQTAS